jgi:hypothetical protein
MIAAGYRRHRFIAFPADDDGRYAARPDSMITP